MTSPSDTRLKQWVDHLHEQGKSSHTIAAYHRAVQHFARWRESAYGGAFDSALVIPHDIEQWKSHQQTIEKVRPNTFNQRLVALSRFFTWTVDKGLARTDPTANVAGIRLETRHPKSLTHTELRRLLRAVHAGGDRRDIALLELLEGTGLRVGELLQLRVGDVTLRERSGWVVVRRGKHAGYRTVPLTAPVRKALTDHLAEHPDAGNPDAHLWLGERGPLRDRSSINRLLAKYARQAQIPAPGPHILRHTFATHYLEANPSDLRGLAALLGHSSLNTVMVYTEPRLEDLAERMERIG